MMSTLTGRYIAEVVRHLPEDQRDDIASEIAATVDDMVTAELGQAHAGTEERIPAERNALRRLGDPAILARSYSGARQYLIGPDVYPVWAQVLRWLLPVVGVLAALASGIVYVATAPQAELGGLIGEVVSGVLSALLWVFAAWTLIVTLVERSTPEGARSPLTNAGTWEPSELDHPPGRIDIRIDAIVSLVLLALLAAVPFVPSTFLYIGHLNGGEPLVNPDIPTVWLAGYLVLTGALALVQVWRLARPGRSRCRLAIEAVTDVVFGAFLTVLVLSQDSVIHPDIVTAGEDDLSTAAIRWSVIATIWVIVVWDQAETLRTYRRDSATAR
ncbi:MAG: HAAS signaling domain-containing protein [Dietzia sp.]